jgi:hypothetical protein
MSAKLMNTSVPVVRQDVTSRIDDIVADFTTIITEDSTVITIQDGIFSEQVGLKFNTGLNLILKLEWM